jgi:hypothetical protein
MLCTFIYIMARKRRQSGAAKAIAWGQAPAAPN